MKQQEMGESHTMDTRRNLGSSTLMTSHFSDQQEFILQLVVLIAAGISIIAGGYALYWFFRIKTFFRHHLVTLLVLSDLSKAVWYFISAAYALKLDPNDFSNAYCQASGFFLSFSIEASDYAILIIAIHSALCIFRPNTNLGETGLYSIRHGVYTLWVALPLLAAGLGLLHGGVYLNSGAFCWLPIRPFWYRLALSWIPRYLIMIFILVLYAMIYLFVSAKFKNLDSTTGNSYSKPSAGDRIAKPRRLIPSLPGFRPSKEEKRPIEPEKEKVPSADSTLQQSIGKPSPAWENFTFGSSTVPLTKPVPFDDLPPPAHSGLVSINKPSVSTQDTIAMDMEPHNARKSLAEFLKEELPAEMAPDLPAMNALVTEDVTNETKARQTAIKRQLRLMFIYPLFYVISWIPPLIQHFTLYNDGMAAHPNFALTCTSACFVALQCAIDSAIFTYRETPWRYLQGATGSLTVGSTRGSNPTFHGKDEPGDTINNKINGFGSVLENHHHSGDTSGSNSPEPSLFHRWSHPKRSSHDSTTLNRLSTGSFGSGFFTRTVGRSQGEMQAEARVARQRREQETHIAIEEQQERQRARKESVLRRGGADRSWWEVEGRKRKDSVLLGLDTDLPSLRSAGDGVGSPSGVASSPRTGASLGHDQGSPKTGVPTTSGDVRFSDTRGEFNDSARNRIGSIMAMSPPSKDSILPTLEEEVTPQDT